MGRCPRHPYVSVGSGNIPFETEEQLRSAAESQVRPGNAGKLFNEIQDDRYVLETALAGRADILVTADVADFRKGSAVRFTRDDVLLFPLADRALVIGTPHFAILLAVPGNGAGRGFRRQPTGGIRAFGVSVAAPLAPPPIRIRDIMEYFHPPQQPCGFLRPPAAVQPPPRAYPANSVRSPS